MSHDRQNRDRFSAKQKFSYEAFVELVIVAVEGHK